MKKRLWAGYPKKTSVKVACVASVSSRVIARKSERKQKKKVEGGGEKRKQRFALSPPPPPSFIFFCSCPSFLDEPREETLATQATVKVVFVSLKL